MTRRDYIALAAALHSAKPVETDRTPACATAAWQAWIASVCAVSAALLQDNPRFDHERFIDACEHGTRKVA